MTLPTCGSCGGPPGAAFAVDVDGKGEMGADGAADAGRDHPWALAAWEAAVSFVVTRRECELEGAGAGLDAVLTIRFEITKVIVH